MESLKKSWGNLAWHRQKRLNTNELSRGYGWSPVALEAGYVIMVLSKVIVPGGTASLTGCNPAPIMLRSSSLFRQGVIACRLHLSSHRTSRKSVSMDSVSG